MARRLRLPSWVEDKPAAKPLAPLRHRISSNEKAFDNLDALERELYAPGSQIDDDEREYLARLLEVKRERLNKRRRSELGEPQGRPATIAPPKQEKRLEGRSRPLKRHSPAPALPNWAWGLGTFIFLLAMIK